MMASIRSRQTISPSCVLYYTKTAFSYINSGFIIPREAEGYSFELVRMSYVLTSTGKCGSVIYSVMSLLRIIVVLYSDRCKVKRNLKPG